MYIHLFCIKYYKIEYTYIIIFFGGYYEKIDYKGSVAKLKIM